MPLPIYGQDNTGTFLLMVTMTLLMTLPHFRKFTPARPSQAMTLPYITTLTLLRPSQANFFSHFFQEMATPTTKDLQPDWTFRLNSSTPATTEYKAPTWPLISHS